MSYAPVLNGVDVQFARITLPQWGRWHVDVRLMGGTQDLTGPQSMSFAGTTYACAIKRAKNEAGSLSARLVGGTNGLGTVVPPKAYSSTPGIQLSLVLNDLMSDCGETLILDGGDRLLGQSYVRMQMPAGRVLNDILGPDGWWMDPSGVIHTGPRSIAPIASNFMATRWRGASGIYVITPDVPGDWTPGRTFANTSVTGTISRVEFDVNAEEVRATVMTGDAATDRLRDPVDSIIEEAQAALLYFLTWPYTVAQPPDPGPPVTMTLLPNDPRAPKLQNVVLWPGPSGAYATPPAGAQVRVRFVAGDSTLPEVVGLDPNNNPTMVTSASTIETDITSAIIKATASASAEMFAPVVSIGDITAQPVAHAAEVALDLTALATLCSALALYLTAGNAASPISSPAGMFSDPGGTLSTAVATLATAVTTAIAANAGALPTTKGLIT